MLSDKERITGTLRRKSESRWVGQLMYDCRSFAAKEIIFYPHHPPSMTAGIRNGVIIFLPLTEGLVIIFNGSDILRTCGEGLINRIQLNLFRHLGLPSR